MTVPFQKKGMNDRDSKVSNHTWEVVDVNYVVPIFVSKFSNHINIEQSQPLQVFLPRQVRNQMKQMFAVKQELVIPAGYEAPSTVSLEVALEEALSCMRKLI